MTTIPFIDLSLAESDPKGLAQDLRRACMDYGFFYLVGHGLSRSYLEDVVLEQSQRLFALPTHVKQQLSDSVLSRGYTALREERLDPARQVATGDTKEGYYIGREIGCDDPQYNPAKFCGPNVWPDAVRLPKFRTTMQAYFDKLCTIGFSLTRVLAVSLNLPHDYFDAAFCQPLAVLRLLRYEAVTSCPEQGLFGCGAHSDYGMWTLLLTDAHKGLQIQTKSGQWMDIPPRPSLPAPYDINTTLPLVVNLGDMLERWTNGLYRSTLHRVLTTTESTRDDDNDDAVKNKDDTTASSPQLPQRHHGYKNQQRHSIPFFYEPAYDTIVSCLPTCCNDTDNPPRYPPITSGEHLLQKYKETHADFTPATTTTDAQK